MSYLLKNLTSLLIRGKMGGGVYQADGLMN
jgi:hypothetical protein